MNMLYYTLCRFSEINDLTTSDLTFVEKPVPRLEIYISRSKTDQFGTGNTKTVYSLTNDPVMCPVNLTKRFLQRLAQYNQVTPYVGFLQPRVHFDVEQQIQIALPHQKICYTSCLDNSKELLAKLGIEGRFGEHSGRRGGATAAADNGASLAEIQTLGNWKDPRSASKYIDQSESQKEKITRLLYPK